jgi:hypothetical protein
VSYVGGNVSRVIQLRPGTDASAAIRDLLEAARIAENIHGSGNSAFEQLESHRSWSSQQARILSTHVTPSNLDDLLTTRRHWLLHSLDLKSYGPAAVSELVSTELIAATGSLREAVQQLRAESDLWSEWRGHNIAGSPLHAVVLDTNVLLRHHRDLVDIEWNAAFNILPHRPIVLGVPLVVIEELDRHKHSNQGS